MPRGTFLKIILQSCASVSGAILLPPQSSVMEEILKWTVLCRKHSLTSSSR